MREVGPILDHLFRHRAGQMVATLTRIFGAAHLELAEEVVQEALLSAMQQWSFHGVPDNPAGWLFRVARNKALDHVRREASLRSKESEVAAALHPAMREDDCGFAHELRDDSLRMMLMCAHPQLPAESRIALMLKTVGGFSVDEIARALMTKKEAIAQRVVRAKRLIRDEALTMELPSRAELAKRLDSVLLVLYLIFNEGYSANEGDDLVRADLCADAIRLVRQLVEHPLASSPAANALLALMLLQAARLPARVDGGELALLADQDRSRWDRVMIADGFRALDRAAAGDAITTYHLEAGIAACHAVAPSFAETDWSRMLELYDLLLALRPSPVVALNRAVARAMVSDDDAAAALADVEHLADDPQLRNYLPLAATLGELSLRLGNRERAAHHFARAIELPGTSPQKRFLMRKLASVGVSR